MKDLRRKRSAPSAGFTLIEMLVVTAVLSLVIGSVAMVGLANGRAYRTGASAAQLEAQIAVAMDRVSRELSTAVLSSLAPDPAPGIGSEQIEYVQATGIQLGQVQWSPLRRLAFEHEPSELDDGLDNDGNGLIDEGRLVLIEDVGGAGERRRVLVRHVRELQATEEENGVDDDGNGLIDERGFFVERDGETLVVRLTLELESEGVRMTRTARTSTRLRN